MNNDASCKWYGELIFKHSTQFRNSSLHLIYRWRICCFYKIFTPSTTIVFHVIFNFSTSNTLPILLCFLISNCYICIQPYECSKVFNLSYIFISFIPIMILLFIQNQILLFAYAYIFSRVYINTLIIWYI